MCVKPSPAKSLIRLLLAGMTALLLLRGHIAWGQRGPTVVEVEEAVEQEISEVQTFVGTVTPLRRAVVGSAVDGRVEEFLVNEGDRVEEGAPLAHLLTDTIKLELKAAEEELKLREQQENELRNGARPDEIEQARARVDAVKATLNYLESERKRLERLISERAVSTSEYDRVVSLYLEAQKRLAEAEATYRLIVDGPREERIAQAAAQTAMQDAVVQKLEDQIKKHTIISRFAGYIAAEHTEVGQWVTRGDPVAEVIALDEVEVVAKVVESHVQHIHLGDSAPVQIPAVPEDKFTGCVTAIVPQADTRSRTFPVKVTVKNKIDDKGTPMLKSGMLARVTLRTSPRVTALVVPKDALLLNDDMAFVWVVDPSTIREEPAGQKQADANRVPVQLGVEEAGLIQIIPFEPTDVVPGSLVISKGNERIPFIPGKSSKVTWTMKKPEPNASASTRQGTTDGAH